MTEDYTTPSALEFRVDTTTVLPDITVYYSKDGLTGTMELCDITDAPTLYCAPSLDTHGSTLVTENYTTFSASDIWAAAAPPPNPAS